MSNGIEIRFIADDDILQLTGLMVELGYPTTVDEMRTRITVIREKENYHTLVAIHQQEICGMIGFAEILFWEQNGFYIKIQVLVVKQSHRGLGIGEHLINACEKIAKEKGATLLALTCGNKEERKAAHRFYPRMGFAHTSSGYIKKLD